MTCISPRLIVLAAACAVAASCSSAPEPAATNRPPLAVQVSPVAPEPLARGFEAGGTIRALTVAPLSSRILAPVEQVHVKAGDRVTRGQRLVTLDARQLTASAAAATATLASTESGAAALEADEQAADAALTLARASYARIASLRDRNSATAGELDEATAALRAAEARREAARGRRAGGAGAIDAARSGADAARVAASYAVITAPFDGLVTEVPAQAGTMASPGMTLLVVEDTRRYRLEAGVDAARSGTVVVGNPVLVTLAGGTTLDGTVAEVTESLDASAHTFIVKIDLPAASGIKSGQFGRARFETADSQGIAVPESALVRRGQLTLVFVEAGGVARMRAVHAGSAAAGRVPVLAGLDPGDRIILDPPAGLLDGTPVTASGGRRP